MNKASLALVLVLFAAGCVSFQGALSAFTLFHTKSVSLVEDVRLSAEAAPDVVIENKKTTLFFDMENAGNSTINSARLTLTDTCILDPINPATAARNFGTLEPGEREAHETELRAQPTDLERVCTVRHALSYNSKATMLSDISVVSEDELTRLNRRGAEADLRIFEVETLGPIDIDLTLSKDQPVPSDTTFFLYLKLRDQGTGDIDSIKAGSLRLVYPANVLELDAAGCDDLSGTGNTLTNSRDLQFFNRETKPIACKFKTKGGGIVSEIGTFNIEASYTYTIRNSLTVTVMPE